MSRELDYLVRHPEPDSTNLSSHVVEHFDRLKSFLPPAVRKTDLVGMKDRDLAPLVRRKLGHRRTILSEQRQEVARQRAERAADRLAHGPRRGASVLLDPALLLRDLLADGSCSHIHFRIGGRDLFFRRSRLWKIARVLFGRDDLRAWLDPGGLHLRWNSGRGGLNLHSEPAPAKPVRLLTVEVPFFSSSCEQKKKEERPPEQTEEERVERPLLPPPQQKPKNNEPAIPPKRTSRPARREPRRSFVDFLTFL